ENDGSGETAPALPGWDDPTDPTPEAIRLRALEAGIPDVARGGIALARSLAATTPILTVVLNGCTTEPLVQAERVLLHHEWETVLFGFRAAIRAIGAPEAIVALSVADRPLVGTLSQSLTERDAITIEILPDRYPQGLERYLLAALRGVDLPVGEDPATVGFAVFDVTTMHALGRALRDGQPFTHRVVTVAGDGVARPGNYRVPLGMPLGALMEAAGASTSARNASTPSTWRGMRSTSGGMRPRPRGRGSAAAAGRAPMSAPRVGPSSSRSSWPGMRSSASGRRSGPASPRRWRSREHPNDDGGPGWGRHPRANPHHRPGAICACAVDPSGHSRRLHHRRGARSGRGHLLFRLAGAGGRRRRSGWRIRSRGGRPLGSTAEPLRLAGAGAGDGPGPGPRLAAGGPAVDSLHWRLLRGAGGPGALRRVRLPDLPPGHGGVGLPSDQLSFLYGRLAGTL